MSCDKKSTLFLCFGAIFVMLGAITLIFWPAIVLAQMKKLMAVTETSETYPVWKENPVPISFEIFLFNITNVDDILAKRATRIKVEQLGPYVYRENLIKSNYTFNDNGTITYYNKRIWHFEPLKSNGSLTDSVTSINPVLTSIAYLRRFSPSRTNYGLNLLLRSFHENLFMTANVTSWLFDGVSDPLLDQAERFKDFVEIPIYKFGWFYERNNSETYEGAYLMNSGVDDFGKLGNIEKWQHSNKTPYRDECGVVKGSSGELFPPESDSDEINVFSSDLCTYITLPKNESKVTIGGVEGTMFASDESLFDNGHNYPEKACYCDDPEWCIPSGALNVSTCSHGGPIFISLPHMYQSDPYYPDKIDGMQPNDNYRIRMVLEPFTGMPLYASAQLQINMLLRHVDGLSIVNVLPDKDTLVPMIWFRQEVENSPEYIRLAKLARNVRYGVPYAFLSITLIGVCLLITGITLLIRKLKKSDDTTPILKYLSKTNKS